MVETVELDIVMGDDLIAKTRDLAFKYFADAGDESLAQVLEVAVKMRYLWSRSMESGKLETNEAVSSWEFTDAPINTENSGTIRNWLFGR